MDRDKVISIIKTKDTQNDYAPSLIETSVDEVEQVIINYCAIPGVPDALNYTVANMTLDLLKYLTEVNKSTDEVDMSDIDVSDVSSIKVGDTSVTVGENQSYNARKAKLTSHISNLDGILMNYRSQLNMFRRLW